MTLEARRSLSDIAVAENPLGLPVPATVPMPVGLRGYQKPTVEQQRALALPVLLKAREWIRRDGWCQGAMRDLKGRWSLHGAIAEAGEGRIQGEYARRAMRDALWFVDLPGWNDKPERERREVLRAFARAIAICRPHRGGWTVSR